MMEKISIHLDCFKIRLEKTPLGRKGFFLENIFQINKKGKQLSRTSSIRNQQFHGAEVSFLI